MSDTILQSYENLLDYADTEHSEDHADGFCADEKADCLTCKWLADAAENCKKLVDVKTITVTVSGGMVQSISGIPAGVHVHVHDYDTDGRDGDEFKHDADGQVYFLGKW